MQGVIKVRDKKTQESKTAVYATNRRGNKQYNVDGKFWPDRQFEKRFEIIGEDLSNNWKVNTAGLLNEIMTNRGMAIMYHPIKIFAGLLVQVGKRASELNDPELNALMCRLAIYEISDPYNKNYDRELTEKTINYKKS